MTSIRRRERTGWAIVALGVLAELYALVSGLRTGAYVINYSLFAIMLFAYAAGAFLFGIRDMILMNLVSAAFAFLFENTSVSFGFPFGYFRHFAQGIRLGNVPLQVGFGYYFYAFAGWLFADLVIGGKNDSLSRTARPLVGSFVASAMDLATDAINGLVLGSYEYPRGGGFFGSPLTNSLGWIITTFAILLVWELLFIDKKADDPNSLISTPSVFHLQNAILIGMMTIGPLIGFFIVKDSSVTDALGNVWQVHYAYEASTMVALLALVFAMLIGIFTWIRKRQVH